MADAVTPATFGWADLVAGYINGNYQSFNAIVALNPGKVAVPISITAGANAGVVLDVETGDATPGQAPGWVQMRRAAGTDPSVYCSESVWGQVAGAFRNAGMSEPHYLIAGYPGSVGYGNLYAGAVAHQDSSPGAYDHSTVADHWPGVDSGSVPSPFPVE